MRKSNNLSQAIAKSPILWGALASAGFYSLIQSGLLSGQFVRRYFASHPVEYVATTMFFIGLAALVLKLIDLLQQHPGLGQSPLGPVCTAGDSVEDCRAMFEKLDRLPSGRQNDYFVRRLREAVEHVRRRRSADSLDDHLKYLADLDAGRLHASYALVRVIIWAIPILGFLGTVIGITLAIANLAPEALENSLPEVTAGLGVAFDTTALALGLSIVLMFAQFVTDRAENALLAQVDDRAAAELAGRFEQIPAGPAGQLVVVRRMAETAETVVQATERLIRQAQQNQLHWDQVQRTQVQAAQAMVSLQPALASQAEMLGRAVEATGKVAGLEETLNRNLAALAGAKHFEQTVMSLAAAINLLGARLAEAPADATPVKLQPNRRTTQAA